MNGYVKEFRKLAELTNNWALKNSIGGFSIHPPKGWKEYFRKEIFNLIEDTTDIEWLWRHVKSELINVSNKKRVN